MTILVTTVGHAFWFATPENEWKQLFWDYLPRWLLVDDTKALTGYYTGASNLSTFEIISKWMVPTLSWTLFITALVLVMLCINVIIRKQWIERERLAYPITQIAFHLTHNTKSLFSHRITWIGFGIAASIAILNGFSFLYPTIPSIPIKRIGGWRGFGHLFTEKPWNAIGDFHFNIYAFVMGLAYFTPLSLSFSLWFFHLFWKLLPVLYTVLGWRTGEGGQVPQRFGAWMGIGILALFTSRNHIKGTVVKFWKGDNEANLYRLAYIGLVFSVILIIAFWYLAGSSPWLVALYFAHTQPCVSL